MTQLVSVPGVPDPSPIVVYVALAGAVLYIAAKSVAQVVEPISAALTKRREFKQANEDARIVDLSHQVDHLAGRVHTLEERAQRQDRALDRHAAWDHQMIQAAIRAGLDVPEPPPLRPTIEP